jgi:hypothetical protein
MGELVVNTTGWTDTTADAVTERMSQQWYSFEAAEEAIQQVISTWTGIARPTWGVLHSAYRDAVRRADMRQQPLAIAGGRQHVPPAVGLRIAAEAYARECRSRDPRTDPHILSGWRSNEPNMEMFASVMAAIGRDES